MDILEKLNQRLTMSRFGRVGLLIDTMNAEREEAAEEIARLRIANNKLVQWKAEIDSRRIAMGLPFPPDYQDSPKYAVYSLIEAEKATRQEERNALGDKIAALLRDYRLAHTVDDEGYGYPLVDAVTPPDQGVITLGVEELENLAGDIAWLVIPAEPPNA